MDAPNPISAPSAQDDVQANKDIAALSYIWVMSVILYIMRRDSPFVSFHAKQGMLLFALSLPLWFVPVVGRFLELFILAGMVIGFLAAAQGEWKEVPIVGPLVLGRATLRQTWRSLVVGIATLARQTKSFVREEQAKHHKAHQAIAPKPETESSARPESTSESSPSSFS